MEWYCIVAFYPLTTHPLLVIWSSPVQTVSSVSNTHSASFTEESGSQIKYLEV